MPKNMFDLTAGKKGGINAEKPKNHKERNVLINPSQTRPKMVESHVYTDDEIAKLLVGYTQISKESWPLLKKNDHIRYRRTNGLFRRGGFIVNQWISIQDSKPSTRMIQLISNPFIGISAKNKPWNIAYDDVSTIWQKNKIEPKPQSNSDSEADSESEPTEKTPKPKQAIGSSEIDLDHIYQQLDAFRVETMRLANEQKNIIELIKRLHPDKFK
jgi:hypothetical protein